MHFNIDPAVDAFRAEVRSFVAAHISDGARGRNATREQIVHWTRLLAPRGWLAPHWPAAWGGGRLSTLHRCILLQELCAPRCPPIDRIAVDMVGPLICAFGSEQQQRTYLPRILDADDVWCQGFSEPQAGSDVNAVRTRATRQGDSYVVGGQKLWTSRAHLATQMFALVRVTADGKPQTGLTFMLIDMRSSGIEVRPIATIDGLPRVNEVFLDDVRVPAANVVGSEGKGWMYARALLANERALIASVPQSRQRLNAVRELACSSGLARDPQFRDRYARLASRLLALEFLLMRAFDAAGEPHVEGPTAVLKLKGAELLQQASELLFEAFGQQSLGYCASGASHDTASGVSDAHAAAIDFLYDRSASIAGGTSEIQRNFIAAGVMGL